jgi:hypothetical protein
MNVSSATTVSSGLGCKYILLLPALSDIIPLENQHYPGFGWV